MHFITEASFSHEEICKMIERAAGLWTGASGAESCRVSCINGSAKAVGTVKITLKGDKVTFFALSHQLMVLALVSGSAALNQPIQAETLRFSNSGKRDGRVSATAQIAPQSDSAPAKEDQKFPLPVGVMLYASHIEDRLRRAVERGTGNTVTRVVLPQDADADCAIVSVKLPGGVGGCVRVGKKDLGYTMAEELTREGFVVFGEPIKYEYCRILYDRGSMSSAQLTVTGIPQ